MSQNRTQFVILSLLRIQAFAGSEIHEFCKTRFSYFWQESYGQIYPNLNELEKQGHIKKLPSSKKRGTKYQITELGLNKLQQWLQKAPAPRVIRDELFLKLYCGGAADLELHLQRIEEARESAISQMAELNDALQEIKLMEGVHPDIPYWRLIIRAGVLSLEARLAWCEEAARELGGLG